MKTTKSILTLLGALAATSTLHAANSASEKSKHEPMDDTATMETGQTSTEWKSTANVQRLSTSELEALNTAKDLIGKSVYDLSGERIGSVIDFSVPQEVTNPYSMRTPARPMNATQEKEHALAPMGPDAKTPGMGRPLTDHDHMLIPNTAQHFSQRTFISVGGVMGLGDEIISIDNRDLRFDTELDGYVVNQNESDLLAMADQNMSLPEPQNYSPASQNWNQEVSAIRTALSSNTDFQRVTVTQRGKDLILEGTVKNNETRQRAYELAADATSQKLQNHIRIQDW